MKSNKSGGNMRKASIMSLLILIFCFTAAKAQETEKSFKPSAKIEFIENKGQFADINGKPLEDVKFAANFGGQSVYARNTGLSFIIRLTKPGNKNSVPKRSSETLLETRQNNSNEDSISIDRIDMNLVSCFPNPEISGAGATGSYNNYYLASCPDGILNVPCFQSVEYRNIYENIDLKLYSNDEDNIEYDFIVKSGGNPDNIRIKFNAGCNINALSDGSIEIRTVFGKVTKLKPLTYIANEQKKQVESSYFLNDDGSISVQVGDYDKNETLIIDPIALVWGTYFGGSNDDAGYCITADGSSNIYILGDTQSLIGIASSAAHQTTIGGVKDLFLTKFNQYGVRQWSTYYGGSGNETAENAHSVSLDESNNIYIAGTTTSTNAIATSGAHKIALGGGNDAFLVKFNNSGIRQWGTYFGGTSDDFGYALTPDRKGNIMLA
ncbi:MAG: trimeric autotransporter adhesin, partial [Bacteroidota bacterium]|nr:trimeric autotransporter adhesin [Bacteroidota bacterium]